MLGRAGVRRQSWHDRPESIEERRTINPRVAAKNTWQRMEALLRLNAFVTAYRLALERFRLGIREALFPAGTYWMRRFAGVNCLTHITA